MAMFDIMNTGLFPGTDLPKGLYGEKERKACWLVYEE